MPVVRVGKRGTLVIPSDIRRKTGVNEGDDVLVDADDNGVIHIMKRPADFVGALRSLAPAIWRGIDPIAFVKEERDEWE